MKRILVVAAWIPIAFTTSAMAQPSGNDRGGKGGEPSPEKFQEMKQEILSRIDNRIQMMQRAKACIQQASNREQMRACRPEGREGGGMHEGHSGGMHEDEGK